MNKEIIKGNWQQLKGKVKQTWGKLTDDEIARMEGRYDELEGLLIKHYGYTKDQAEKSINEFTTKSGLKEKTF